MGAMYDIQTFFQAPATCCTLKACAGCLCGLILAYLINCSPVNAQVKVARHSGKDGLCCVAMQIREFDLRSGPSQKSLANTEALRVAILGSKDCR